VEIGFSYLTNFQVRCSTKMATSCSRLSRTMNIVRFFRGVRNYLRILPKANRKPGIGSPNIDAIIAELIRQAGRRIGDLQTIRAEMKGRPLPKSPSAHKIFGRTHHDPHGDYAFHFGGGSEFQFNVGLKSDLVVRREDEYWFMRSRPGSHRERAFGKRSANSSNTRSGRALHT
jgi:hypothetical protein